MNNYKPKFVQPEDYERMRANEGKPFPLSDYRMERWEWDRHLRKLNVYSKEQFAIYRERLAQQFRDRKSNWFQRLVGLAWFNLILPLTKKHLTPKRLMGYLTKIDIFLPYMPDDTWKKILRFLDQMAEIVYKKME